MTPIQIYSHLLSIAKSSLLLFDIFIYNLLSSICVIYLHLGRGHLLEYNKPTRELHISSTIHSSSVRFGLVDLLTLLTILTGLILCRYYAGDSCYYEFTSALNLSRPRDSTFLWSTSICGHFLSATSSAMVHELCRCWMRVMLMSLLWFSILLMLFSAQPLTNYINYHIFQKKTVMRSKWYRESFKYLAE